MLGYGVYSYLDLTKKLMWMVGIISVLMVLPMWKLSELDGLSSYPSYATNKYTLGNIGGAQSICAQARPEQNSLVLDCNDGTYIDLDAKAGNHGEQIFDLGLIPWGYITNICAW